MCQRCTDDDLEYTHLSDLAAMLSDAFVESGGEDLPVILDDMAGDYYQGIDKIQKDEQRKVYRAYFSYGKRFRG